MSGFCDSRGVAFRDLAAFSPFEAGESFVFRMFLLKSFKAYLCSGTFRFDREDFGGRRPGEVIGLILLALSVLPFMPHVTIEYTLKSSICFALESS